MQMALLSKEMRECSLYAALALLAQMQWLGDGMDLPLIPVFGSGRGQEIPFLNFQLPNRESVFGMTGAAAGIVFGLHQSLWESWRQTTLFLLHRPLPRSQIFLAKLAAGALLLLAVTYLPLLIYALWAATPGTHASPFSWSMTETWWRDASVAFICYAGAFLTGLQPGRWIGSKSWPLIAAILFAIALRIAPFWPPFVYFLALATLTCFLVTILDTAQRREYP